MNVNSPCYGVFVDIDNNLYCSLGEEHQVVKQLLDTDGNILKTIIAGEGVCGSNLNMLCGPKGIFVTIKFDLYVADSGNNRIRFFPFRQLTGKTVVGDIETLGIRLKYPTSVVVDGDNYLFIVDSENNRIIRSNSNGFYCVVGCSTVAGSASDQLDRPFAVAFDNAGNIFVADRNNDGIQKFMLMTNTDGM
jgi:DNA-binding beta-propeller fold protein YncE